MSLIPSVIAAFNNRKDKSLSIIRKTHEYEFLPAYLEIIEKPPSPWGRRSAIVILAFLFSVLVWSIWGRLDIHASAQGKVMVSSHSKVIQALEQGEVIAINVRDGQRVKKGEILIQLNPTGIDAESRRLSERYNHLNINRSRILALLSDDPLNSFSPPIEATQEQIAISKQHLISEYNETHQLIERLASEAAVNKAQQEANQREINSLSRLKTNIETRLNARKALIASNFIARIELLEQEKELLEIERNISNMQAQRKVLAAQAQSLSEQKDTLIAQKQVDYYDQLNQLNSQIAEISQELIKVKERQRVQALRSPVDGVVQQLNIHTLGGVVSVVV
ncbi:MAG: biotin/lipoyl-binding protein [Vibrio sp.]